MPTARKSATPTTQPQGAKRKSGRLLLPLGLALFAAWIAVVVVGIAKEPDPGAASPQQLTSGVAETLHKGDAESLARYVNGDGADAYATSLVDKVKDSGNAGDISVSRLGEKQVQMRAPHLCMTWDIAKSDGRLFLDPVPPLTSVACPAR
ncbi:hypothetical protein [Streptomyces benahoarensis]|uniref:Uncharacterized protein n=1 Tax=Streptomyces benahoarensis TaxID=2595054 RepID=A0A553ZM50_9ACTN|nr:hypothetical protein [Streptomyces benahoarensis]TSB21724.1 hypothetical protein FNJ62_17600 [Streptomyces benahoarensis]TSB42376.1 hypothetical protein FNZ23_10185 [Streptomyces benahoarensis]